MVQTLNLVSPSYAAMFWLQGAMALVCGWAGFSYFYWWVEIRGYKDGDDFRPLLLTIAGTHLLLAASAATFLWLRVGDAAYAAQISSLNTARGAYIPMLLYYAGLLFFAGWRIERLVAVRRSSIARLWLLFGLGGLASLALLAFHIWQLSAYLII